MAGNALVPELAVTDIGESLRFYEALGFTVLYDRPREGFALVERDGCQIMLDQIGSGRTWETGRLQHPLGRGVNFQLPVSDLDELVVRVAAMRIDFFLPLETATYSVAGELQTQRQFCIQDPDGYLLRFCEPGDRP